MDIPFLCVLLVFLLNYLTKIPVASAMAKLPGGYNNHLPRDQQAQLTDRGKRALGAHLNGFEVFPAFAAAVIMAHLTGVNANILSILSVIFVVSRLIYIYLYLNDKATLRSLIWGIGILCVLFIFIAAIF